MCEYGGYVHLFRILILPSALCAAAAAQLLEMELDLQLSTESYP